MSAADEHRGLRAGGRVGDVDQRGHVQPGHAFEDHLLDAIAIHAHGVDDACVERRALIGKAADHVERALAQFILKFDDVFVRTQFFKSLAADLVERPGAFELRREIRRDARTFGRGGPARAAVPRAGRTRTRRRADDASARHTSAVLVSEMRCGNMDDSTAARDSAVRASRVREDSERYLTRMETSAVRPRESRAVILCGPTASGQWNGASLDERPASTPSMDQ